MKRKGGTGGDVYRSDRIENYGECYGEWHSVIYPEEE
jgi:hypothetical protein